MRTCHIVDVQNLCGGDTHPLLVTQVWRSFVGAAEFQASDQLVLVAGRKASAVAWFNLPSSSSRIIARPGEGPAAALLRLVPAVQLSERFERIVIGSGDGRFSSLVKQLTDKGTTVVVVSLKRSLSSLLRRASEIRLLDTRQPGPRVPSRTRTPQGTARPVRQKRVA